MQSATSTSRPESSPDAWQQEGNMPANNSPSSPSVPELQRQIDMLNLELRATAVENARLHTDLQERTGDLQKAVDYQTAIGEVLKVIGRSTFDLQQVLQTLTEVAARLCQADMAFMSRRDGQHFHFLTAAGTTSESTADAEHFLKTFLHTVPFVVGRETMTGRVLQEGRVLQIPDIRKDKEFVLPEAMTIARIRTLLGVPLLREGKAIGVLNLARQRIQPFNDRQIDLVRTFADQAVIAIENARLLTEQREALEQQQATSEVLQVINASLGQLEPVFDALLKKATSFCEAAFGILWTYDGQNYHAAAFRRVPPAYA